MGRFLYHFVRIIPILALAAIYAALLYIIVDKGRWVKVALVGGMGLASLVTLGHWLYSGYFVIRPFLGYLRWYWKYRLRKNFTTALTGFAVGVCVVVAIRFVKGHNPLADPIFYLIMLGFGLLILLSGIFSGYIKYCYRRNGKQRE